MTPIASDADAWREGGLEDRICEQTARVVRALIRDCRPDEGGAASAV